MLVCLRCFCSSRRIDTNIGFTFRVPEIAPLFCSMQVYQLANHSLPKPFLLVTTREDVHTNLSFQRLTHVRTYTYVCGRKKSGSRSRFEVEAEIRGRRIKNNKKKKRNCRGEVKTLQASCRTQCDYTVGVVVAQLGTKFFQVCNTKTKFACSDDPYNAKEASFLPAAELTAFCQRHLYY